MIKSYQDLVVWQRSVELVKEVYLLTKDFPKSETYSLVDQMKRSAISVPSNIAEGHARQHSGEFRQFLFIALGSLAELETQLIIANKLGYLEQNQLRLLLKQTDEIGKMLRGLVKKIISASSTSP